MSGSEKHRQDYWRFIIEQPKFSINKGLVHKGCNSCVIRTEVFLYFAQCCQHVFCRLMDIINQICYLTVWLLSGGLIFTILSLLNINGIRIGRMSKLIFPLCLLCVTGEIILTDHKHKMTCMINGQFSNSMRFNII
jgi:hypothetical protein